MDDEEEKLHREERRALWVKGTAAQKPGKATWHERWTGKQLKSLEGNMNSEFLLTLE